MLLIRNWAVYGYCLLAAVMTGVLGGYGYWTFWSLPVNSTSAAKYRIENLVLIALIFILLLVVLAVLMVRKSTDVLNELDKAVDLARYGRSEIGGYLSRWGGLGMRIGALVNELNRLNDAKTVKITALSGVNAFFMENTGVMLLSFDPGGTIVGCSRKFLEETEQEKSSVVNGSISDALPGLNTSRLTAGLLAQHGPVRLDDIPVRTEGGELRQDFTFYPVFDSSGTLVHIVCVRNEENFIMELTEKGLQLPDQVREQGQKLHRKLFGLIRKGMPGFKRDIHRSPGEKP